MSTTVAGKEAFVELLAASKELLEAPMMTDRTYDQVRAIHKRAREAIAAAEAQHTDAQPESEGAVEGAATLDYLDAPTTYEWLQDAGLPAGTAYVDGAEFQIWPGGKRCYLEIGDKGGSWYHGCDHQIDLPYPETRRDVFELLRRLGAKNKEGQPLPAATLAEQLIARGWFGNQKTVVEAGEE